MAPFVLHISPKTSLGDICHDAMKTAFISCCNTERVNYGNPNKCTLKPLKHILDYTVISLQQGCYIKNEMRISTNTEFKLNL